MQNHSTACNKSNIGISEVRRYSDDELPNLLEKIIRTVQEHSSAALDQPTPSEEGHILFVSEQGSFACGVWRGGPGVINIESYPVDEFCLLVTGDVLLQDSNGGALHLTAGSAFLIPKGFRGSWTTRNKCQKYFACHGTRESIATLCGEAQ